MTRRTLIVAAALAVAVGGCGSANKSAGKNDTTSSGSGASGAKAVKVAFVYPTTTTNFAQEMALGAKAAAGDTAGVKLTESAPAEVNGPKQVQLFQAATRTSKDGVAMMTLTPDLFIRPLQTAKSLLAKIPADAKGEVLIGTDTPGLPVLEQRNAGFKEVMQKERPGVTFLVFDAKQSPTDNFNTWSAQVKAHPDALAYVGPGSQAAVSLSRIQRKPGAKKLLVGACDLDPVALQGVKDGYVEALISPEHWVKGYLAVKLMADAAQSGKPLQEGLWNSGALTVNSDNIDDIITRQKDAASRAAYFKDVVQKQLDNQDQYLGPMPTGG